LRQRDGVRPRRINLLDPPDVLAAVGIPVTEDGKVRARRRIAEAEDRFTPELREQARRQLGMPPRAAA